MANPFLKSLATKTFSNAVLATLETAVNAWLATPSENVLVDIRWLWDGTNYVCLITYAEG